MERLYLEITASGNVSSEVFVRLIGVPAKRCKLRGKLRVLDFDCTKITVVVEGPEDEVRDYYNYMSLLDDLVGTVTKVEEEEVENYRETNAFYVEDYSPTSDESEGDVDGTVKADDEVDSEGRKAVGTEGEEERCVIPETPEKEEQSSSESEEEAARSISPPPPEEETYLEPPMSPVFKGGRPPKRLEPVDDKGTANLFERCEESQSLLHFGRKRKRT